MNVLWIKDGNIGHEKQVRVLLDQLLKNKQLNIIERTIKGIFPFFTYINDVEENYYDLIIVWHVFEHIINDQAAIQNLSKCLNH